MTSQRAEQIQTSILERLSMAERLQLACEMSDLAHGLHRARIRMEHPDWTEQQVTRELVRAAFAPRPCPI